jgi:LmbE family N-acetylglucosaminyl deacetylase
MWLVNMLKLSFSSGNREPKILCLGAHPDDIEIGCGGTILRLIEEIPKAQFYWVVFSGDNVRREEARSSAQSFLKGVERKEIVLNQYRDSYFPFVGTEIKDNFEKLKGEFSPDIIFTHYGRDAHQDHRLISKLTWNTFRDSLVLEYEIPKFDGDLSTPNTYVELNESQVEKKIDLILKHFNSQREKRWFDEETFRSILRIRGIESNSARYAEGFHSRKITF